MGFHILFTFTLQAVKSTGFGEETSSKGRKRLKREGKERYWGKNGNGKQKLKTDFCKLFLFLSKQRKCKKSIFRPKLKL